MRETLRNSQHSLYDRCQKATENGTAAGMTGLRRAQGSKKPLADQGLPEAEDARFELARACTQHAFQACAIDH